MLSTSWPTKLSTHQGALSLKPLHEITFYDSSRYLTNRPKIFGDPAA